MRGPETALGGPGSCGWQMQHTAALDRHPVHQGGVTLFGRHLGNQHGGYGCEKIRIKNLDQTLRKLRELGVELELDTRCEKRKTLQQSFDVRVLHILVVDVQAPGDLGKLQAELPAHFLQVFQLLLVMADEARVHAMVRVR